MAIWSTTRVYWNATAAGTHLGRVVAVKIMDEHRPCGVRGVIAMIAYSRTNMCNVCNEFVRSRAPYK